MARDVCNIICIGKLKSTLMDYKTIHDYLDDNFPLVDETETTVTFGIPDTGYLITLIPTIGTLPQSTKEKIIDSIYDMILNDPSHSVAGTYSIENITARPDNIYLLISKSEKIEFILNIKDYEDILIHSYLFSSFNDPIEATIVLNHIILFLSMFDKIFIFCSGLDLVVFLQEYFVYENISDQIVYRLRANALHKSPDKGDDELLIFDGLSNNDNLTVIREAFGYDDKEDNLINYLGINPHVIIKQVGSNEIKAKARINAFTKKFAVIGGVETIRQFRKQGLGLRISFEITNFIFNKSENVVLDTDTENFPAAKIYEKIGFEPIGKSIFLEKGKNVIASIHGHRDY